MLLEHEGRRPSIHASAYVAPNATVSGDVTIGPECRILFSAVLTAEGGPVILGSHCVVMEQAVVRGTKAHPLRLGDHVLVGPHAHLSGCTVEDNVFIATGASVFNGARIGARSTVRINGVVHIKTVLAPDTVVPIGWVAVGDPARILPPNAHDEIWAVQGPLNFSKTVFGLDPAPAGQSN
ncbi:MAG: gamma carbonic anhydrase family protein, partial [Candidatus Rokubacteria bacterium]|nr:gamma carbonic anhydrase family protein [Candidatus Rokubacteria bacterium]